MSEAQCAEAIEAGRAVVRSLPGNVLLLGPLDRDLAGYEGQWETFAWTAVLKTPRTSGRRRSACPAFGWATGSRPEYGGEARAGSS